MTPITINLNTNWTFITQKNIINSNYGYEEASCKPEFPESRQLGTGAPRQWLGNGRSTPAEQPAAAAD